MLVCTEIIEIHEDSELYNENSKFAIINSGLRGIPSYIYKHGKVFGINKEEGAKVFSVHKTKEDAENERRKKIEKIQKMRSRGIMI